MNLIVLIVLIFLLLGGGFGGTYLGWYGPNSGHYPGGVSLVLVILVVLLFVYVIPRG